MSGLQVYETLKLYTECIERHHTVTKVHNLMYRRAMAPERLRITVYTSHLSSYLMTLRFREISRFPRSASLLVAQLILKLRFPSFQSSELSATLGFEDISIQGITPSTL